MRNRIITALRTSSDASVQQAASKVSQNFVFDNPTVARLASAILALNSGAGTERSRAEQIVELIDKYAADLPVPKQTQGRVVLLTRSTGNIGAHILSTLLSDEHVAKVYTLDRRSSGATPLERLHKAFEQRGLPVQLLTKSRVGALAGDFNEDLFGLDKETFDEVSSELARLQFGHNQIPTNNNYRSKAPLLT